MKALEVWINGQKKCVAGTGDYVLNAVIDLTGHFQSPVAGLVHVGGLIDKGGDSFHVR